MINCEKATYLTEKKGLGKLTLKESFILKFHSSICKMCKNYNDDSRVLGKVLRSMNGKQSSTCLSDQEKDDIKKKLSA